MKVYDLKVCSNLRCVKTGDNSRIVFYQENMDEISTINLNIPIRLKVIAVNTKKADKEISISPELVNGFLWDAAYSSDRAVPIGDFM
ncbi:MAG: hypothetical protein HKN87_03730 [Saprospiraceae bacterium]|nr:hypothetical protein [Saprospiraceae bacterium]